MLGRNGRATPSKESKDGLAPAAEEVVAGKVSVRLQVRVGIT